MDIVKEEEEIAKIRMQNVQHGLDMGIVCPTRISCKQIAQKLATFAEKKIKEDTKHTSDISPFL